MNGLWYENILNKKSFLKHPPKTSNIPKTNANTLIVFPHLF